MLVLQLSTNDARTNQKLGKVSDDDHFDTQTIIGAMEYIISQAQATWHCPIKVLDLYNNPDFKDQPALYMADEIHPTRAGYLEKWLPVFEDELTKILAKKINPSH